MTSKFCPMPWSHLQVDPDGTVRPCCISQPIPNAHLGNINDQPLEEIWNAPRMKQLRLNILDNKPDDICQVCYQYDDTNLPSFRAHAASHMMERFDNVKESIKSTLPDGTVPKMNLEYWDFRFSNICNFKCRTCGPGYSSLWYSDAEKLGWHVPETKRPITWLGKVDDRLAQMAPHVNTVKEIYFAGGEPLIMDEHYRALDLLIANNRNDVKIRYNTNLSTLKYKSKDVIDDYWSNFKLVEVSGSLDAVGARAEYIRAGTKWEQVDGNIQRLVQASRQKKITLMFNITVSVFNVLYLDEILDYLIDVGAIRDMKDRTTRPWQFHFNMVFFPKQYCISNMPISAKKAVRAKLDSVTARLKEQYNSTVDLFSDLYAILDQPAEPAYIRMFIDNTKQLDEIRSENINDVLPELYIHYKSFV